VEFTPEKGLIPFADDRTATLEATPDTLTLRIRGGRSGSPRAHGNVVVEHLKRFSFREDLGEIRWTRANNGRNAFTSQPVPYRSPVPPQR